MLTPDKIRQKSFQTTGRGSYRAEDVDSFINEVLASYEQMFKENGDLIKKISILAKKVEEYRADEESLKLALLNAQKLADRIVAEAKETAEKETLEAQAEVEKIRSGISAEAEELKAKAKTEADEILTKAKTEAEAIVKDADIQSKEILGKTNRQVTHETLVYDMTKKEASEFKAKLVAMYKEHINLINQLPEIVDAKLDECEKAEEPQQAVEEAVEEEIVVIEEPQQVVEVVEEAEAIEAVEEAVEESIDEVEVVEEAEEAEETIEEPAQVIEAPVKKPFKLDLSKVDFADVDESVEPTFEAVVEAPVDDYNVDGEEPDSKGSISFKNFFKKK